MDRSKGFNGKGKSILVEEENEKPEFVIRLMHEKEIKKRGGGRGGGGGEREKQRQEHSDRHGKRKKREKDIERRKERSLKCR